MDRGEPVSVSLAAVVEPAAGLLLEFVLNRGRGVHRHRYEYVPEHFPWLIVALVLFGVGLLAFMAWTSTGAFASERQLTRLLQDRLDEGALRNSRTLDEL